MDTLFHIWWHPVQSAWHISSNVGIPGAAYWNRVDPNPVGEYNNFDGATGIATVIIGEHP